MQCQDAANGYFVDSAGVAQVCSGAAACGPGQYPIRNSCGTPSAPGTTDTQCTNCPGVTNALASATYTCADASTSRVSGCAAGFFKSAGSDAGPGPDGIDGTSDDIAATADTCEACTVCAAGTFIATACGAAADTQCTNCAEVSNRLPGIGVLTCEDASSSRVTGCSDGFYKTAAASADAADTCDACTTLDNAAVGATYTCTTASSSRVSAWASGD